MARTLGFHCHLICGVRAGGPRFDFKSVRITSQARANRSTFSFYDFDIPIVTPPHHTRNLPYVLSSSFPHPRMHLFISSLPPSVLYFSHSTGTLG